jgi:HK97 gp10 family phage protein
MKLEFSGDGGLRSLSSDLNTAHRRVGAKASKAVKDAAAKVARDARAAAPVDTGTLRDSMEVRVFGDGRSGGITAVVAPTANHSIFVEFGTVKMSPQPFFFPALDANVDDFTRALADALDDAL